MRQELINGGDRSPGNQSAWLQPGLGEQARDERSRSTAGDGWPSTTRGSSARRRRRAIGSFRGARTNKRPRPDASRQDASHRGTVIHRRTDKRVSASSRVSSCRLDRFGGTSYRTRAAPRLNACVCSLCVRGRSARRSRNWAEIRALDGRQGNLSICPQTPDRSRTSLRTHLESGRRSSSVYQPRGLTINDRSEGERMQMEAKHAYTDLS